MRFSGPALLPSQNLRTEAGQAQPFVLWTQDSEEGVSQSRRKSREESKADPAAGAPSTELVLSTVARDDSGWYGEALKKNSHHQALFYFTMN